MPKLPWTRSSETDDNRPCVVMASYLPLARRSAIPSFVEPTMAIRRQLRTAPGLLGYSLDADLPHCQFWTLSAWVDRSSLGDVAEAEPHRSSIDHLQPGQRTTK